MIKIFHIILFFFILNISLSNSSHWLLEVDCDKNSNFFEIRTFNTYNINNCNEKNEYCGEYTNLTYHSIFHENKEIHNDCNLMGRNLEYSLTPVNMGGSSYDTTPYFIININIDGRNVIKEVPLYPSPIYKKSFWGLKISSIIFNGNSAHIQISISDNELYESTNDNKIKPLIHWLWDSDYISAFDPDWSTSWKPLTENDIWDEIRFQN